MISTRSYELQYTYALWIQTQDGHVLLAGVAGAQPAQARGARLREVLDSDHVQRAPRDRVQGVEVQQFLLRTAAALLVPLHAAGRLLRRQAAAQLALRALQRLRQDLQDTHQASWLAPKEYGACLSCGCVKDTYPWSLIIGQVSLHWTHHILMGTWQIPKYWNKSFRTSKILTLLYQQFSN